MEGRAGEGASVNCPICQGETVVLSKVGNDRRRKCATGCGKRFTTTEVLKEEQNRLKEIVQDAAALAAKVRRAA